MKERFVYGPVPSRRLGRSLGVDLVPFKICSYDCIYCQLGSTKQKTIEQKPYIPVDKILNQVHQKLKKGADPDWITLASSGEPTLHSEIGSVIHEIKTLTETPVAVLTNSSLLGNHLVRQSLMEADAILPSLDAYDQEGFDKVNRPHPRITFEAMTEGLVALGKEYPGEIWLEVFILEGINATESDAMRFKEWIEKVNPHKVHVNTAVRPAAEAYARQVPPETLVRFCKILGEKAEVIAPFRGSDKHEPQGVVEKDLLNLLARRPCTLEDISSGLNVNSDEIVKHIKPLVQSHVIEKVERGSVVYYQPKKLP